MVSISRKGHASNWWFKAGIKRPVNNMPQPGPFQNKRARYSAELLFPSSSLGQRWKCEHPPRLSCSLGSLCPSLSPLVHSYLPSLRLLSVVGGSQALSPSAGPESLLAVKTNTPAVSSRNPTGFTARLRTSLLSGSPAPTPLTQTDQASFSFQEDSEGTQGLAASSNNGLVWKPLPKGHRAQLCRALTSYTQKTTKRA